MSTPEIGVAIGGAALILALLAYAQRLGTWENKHRARLLAIAAGGSGIAWLLYFVPKPWAWIATMLVVGLITWPLQGWLEQYRVRGSPPILPSGILQTFGPEDGRDHWMRTAIDREARLNECRAQVERQTREIDSLREAGTGGVSTAALPPYRKELLHISFNYLPQSPLERDWTLLEGTAVFSMASEGRAMIIKAPGRFAMDRIINEPSVQAKCRCIEFSAHLPRGSSFYVGVTLDDSHGNAVDSGKDGGIFWIDYVCVKQSHPIVGSVDIEDGWTNERAIRVAEGWQRFSLNLPEAVGKAYPGLTLRSVSRVRVRNSLSISPLWFYAAGNATIS